MKENKYFEALGKPFPAGEVSWKIQVTNKEKTKGMAVPYLDARAISNRLDAVVGQNNWKDEYKPWHNYVTKQEQKFAQLCTIYIYDEERKEWIGKTDGAEDSDISPIKGGLSDALKRAAVRWNIGRYLYDFEDIWVEIEPRGGSYVIKKSERAKLADFYTKSVAALFGTQPAAGKQSPPAASGAQAADDGGSGNGQVFEIKDVRIQETENGASSAIKLYDGQKQYTVFLRGKDERLKIGTKIRNLKTEQHQNVYGPINILNGYDVAA